MNETPLRVVFALPVVLFIPGYVLIAALFPGSTEIDSIERIALSFGLSIAVVPLIGLALNYTPFGIRLDPIVLSLTIFTLGMVLATQVRRARVPPGERFVFSPGPTITAVRDEFFSTRASRLDRALSLILMVAIVAAVATTVYVVVVPKEGEKFTEFYILGREGMAAEYPTDLTIGKPDRIILGIGNHEYRNVTYTVEILLLNITESETTNTSEFHRMELLDSFSATLSHNTTFQEQRSILVNSTGYNQIKFLLYNTTAPPDDLPVEERIRQSYRDLHLWVKVHPL